MLELVTLMVARPASRLRRSRTRDSVIRPPWIPDISMISTGLAADAARIYLQSRNPSKRNRPIFVSLARFCATSLYVSETPQTFEQLGVERVGLGPPSGCGARPIRLDGLTQQCRRIP